MLVPGVIQEESRAGQAGTAGSQASTVQCGGGRVGPGNIYRPSLETTAASDISTKHPFYSSHTLLLLPDLPPFCCRMGASQNCRHGHGHGGHAG